MVKMKLNVVEGGGCRGCRGGADGGAGWCGDMVMLLVVADG